MSACTDNIIAIQPNECIGDSLTKINDNFSTLQTTTQDLENRFNKIKRTRTFFYYGPNTDTNIVAGAYNYGAPFNTSSAVYPVSHGSWGTFMNQYAVWVNPSTDALVKKEQIRYRKLTIVQSGLYTVECQADNKVSIYIDNILVAESDNYTNTIKKVIVNLNTGLHTLQFRATNYTGNNNNWNTNPAGWACRITNSSSQAVWDTRTFAAEESSDTPIGSTSRTVITDNTTTRPSNQTIESFVNSGTELNLPSISRTGDTAYVIYQKTGFNSTVKDGFTLNDSSYLLNVSNTTTPPTPGPGGSELLEWDKTYNLHDYWSVVASADGAPSKLITLYLTITNPSVNNYSYKAGQPNRPAEITRKGDDTYIGFDNTRVYAGEGYPGAPQYTSLGPTPGDTGTFKFTHSKNIGYSQSIKATKKVWTPGVLSTVSNETTEDIINSFNPVFIIWKLTYNGDRAEYFVDSGFPKFTQALTSDTANWNNPLNWNFY